MNVTGQLIAQIDAIIQDIHRYNNAVAAEKQRTEKAKADAAARCVAMKQKIQQQANSEIQSYKNALQAAKDTLNTSWQEVAAFESQLSRLVPRRKIPAIPAISDKFTAADARDLIARIKETGFWAWVKKMLSIGNYGKNVDMAAELYGKIDNANNYFKNAIAAEEKKYGNRINICTQGAEKKKAAADAQYKQDIKNEENVHISKIHVLDQQKRKLAADPRIEALRRQMVDAVDLLGASPDGWKTFVPAKEIPQELLIGVILYPCKIGKPTQEETDLLKLCCGYTAKVNGFNIPLTASTGSPLLLYSECETGDVQLAASLYQSVIARMIRFMPPKSLRAVFFDPVNRSTSLGQLIHLSGEGTSRICEYHLSPHDINTYMGKLTEHVDNVCRKLTGAGCSDINAYNSIPKVARIPYTAVVIHDYPNGFDSASLGCLQVLINKAKQCGISIMISHKQGDKIENKALDVLNLIKRSFYQISISAQAKAQIKMGTVTYPYKSKTAMISETYLNEINKYFTYKPSVDNRFEKFFDGKPPVYRSSREGLTIPFAVDADGEIVDLKIGYDLSAHGFICGGTGSGKTTLLHMIITSAVMHYHPSELELWLVDYKIAEFSFYMRNCPPHVRYVVADTSSEISYSILDEIEEEIRRRNRAFVSAGVKDYAEYRECPYSKSNSMPRLLILVDEFHRMAQAAQEETEYKVALENIFSEARSAGIVLLLSDQQISNGLSGLSQKSRDLISVRISLKNKADEVRETLAIENAQMTDDVKKMIQDTTSANEGTGIYKYEVKNKADEFANQVIFKRCRGIFATSEKRKEVIDNIIKKYPQFERDKTFFVGAARQHMDVRQIKKFEKQHPQPQDIGDRFYIGTPLGIQPCFFFNLKPAESGENVLLVGNNQEKRIAILKAVLSCAFRYGYTVRFLISRASQLYRHNKNFFDSLTGAEVITSFPEICKFVGENANKLQAMYSEDEDFEMEGETEEKQLVIFIGLDELYSQMERSPYNQKTAWTIQASTEQQQTGSASSDSRTTGFPVTPPSAAPVFGREKGTRKQENDYNLSGSLAAIDDFLKSLETEDDDSAVDVESIPEKMAGPAVEGIKGYNAVQDLGILLSDGWKTGINSMVIVDRGTVFGKLRQIKLDGNFNHRIALVMSPDEAQAFMAKTRVMKTLIDTNDTISAVYEYLGGREQCFRPYIFDEGKY